jgi:hypothetical protein
MFIRVPLVICFAAICAVALIAATGHHTSVVSAAAAQLPAPWTPVYSKEGDLTPPLQYREWVYLTTGMNMSYSAKASDMDKFDNVFVNPEAYRSFMANGTWPDKTVLVLEQRAAGSKSSINQSGHFQSGGIQGLEVHIKDEARFPGKWAFFDVESETKATLIPQGASCYTCHQDHAAVDTSFVQFYPTLLPIATKKATLSAAYLKETPATGK